MSPKVLWPIGVLAIASVLAVVIFVTTSPLEARPPEQVIPPVRIARVEMRDVEMLVRSQGSVAPRTESQLIPEVSGPVVWTSPRLVSGGVFAADEILLRVDDRDYKAAVARAESARMRTEGERDHAASVLARQRGLAERGIVSPAALEDAERGARVTEATLREATVTLEQARRDLARTEIRAPYSGRVRDAQLGVGQFVTRGQAIATLYATDFLEVRLPIPDRELAFLGGALWTHGGDALDGAPTDRPAVRLRAQFAGAERTWLGELVRTEGEIDPKTRMVRVVARLDSARLGAEPPPPVGLFVQAEIVGTTAKSVAVVPRAALRDGGTAVLIVDDEDRLRTRPIEILRAQGDAVLVRSGLRAGDRLCLSSLDAPVDGMAVAPVPSSPVPAVIGAPS
jgi:RND family efflux transporter MFP subunit